ncbi:hypothetical protein LTR10_005810 [Elasticomyces elasticus]|nr:hypothetical protein LTR10_005810 [Elasticomyces elasticus]KAK4965017.1 hypothetical protein LTR42_012435 [Elasticomyces elasticus]
MSYGSPVFKALFSPDKFYEGTTLATNSTVEIPLPEDDPYYMSILCSILHMRHDMVPKFTAATMKAFAKLCDKYDCGLAVKPVLDQNIMAKLPDATASTLMAYLEIVVTLHYTEAVERIATLLVYHSIEPLVSSSNDRDSLELDTVIAMIELTRLRATREIVVHIDFIFDKVGSSTQMYECFENGCKSFLQRTFSMMEQLKAYKLRSETAEDCSLEDMLRSMENIRLRDPRDLKVCTDECENVSGLSQYDAGFHHKAAQICMLVKGTSFLTAGA